MYLYTLHLLVCYERDRERHTQRDRERDAVYLYTLHLLVCYEIETDRQTDRDRERQREMLCIYIPCIYSYAMRGG